RRKNAHTRNLPNLGSSSSRKSRSDRIAPKESSARRSPAKLVVIIPEAAQLLSGTYRDNGSVVPGSPPDQVGVGREDDIKSYERTMPYNARRNIRLAANLDVAILSAVTVLIEPRGSRRTQLAHPFCLRFAPRPEAGREDLPI